MAGPVAFTVPGAPRGKGRARVAPGHSRPYTPADTIRAEKEIAALFLQARGSAKPLTGPVALTITAVFQIPVSWPKSLREAAARGVVPCTSKPDRDNIEKLVCDALNGLAWADDAQICDGPVRKRYGSPARTEVQVTMIDGPDIPRMPAEERREARLTAPPRPKPRRPVQSKQTKSKLPPKLQAAVDKALGKGKR